MKGIQQSLLTLIVVLFASGCATLSPSGSDMLRNQQPVSKYDHNKESVNLSKQYPSVNIEPIEITQKDGNVSKGIHIKQADAQVTILYFGPNNYPIVRQHKHVIPYLTKLKANLVWLDYRGFGFTSGEADFDILKRDAKHIYATVRQNVKGPLVLHGLSIGSILAIEVASTNKVEHLVLEGSITTVEDWVDYSFVEQAYYSHGVPRLFGYLLKPLFEIKPSAEIATIDNTQALASHDGTLLLLSAENDWETPPSLSEKLFKSIDNNNKAEFYTLNNVGHLDALTSNQSLLIYKTFFKEEFEL